MKLPVKIYTVQELDLKSSFSEEERAEIARKVFAVIQSVYKKNILLYDVSLKLIAVLKRKVVATKAIQLLVNPERRIVYVKPLNVFMKRETPDMFSIMRRYKLFIDEAKQFNDTSELESFVETFIETAKKYAKHIIAFETRDKTIYIYIILEYQKLQ